MVLRARVIKLRTYSLAQLINSQTLESETTQLLIQIHVNFRFNMSVPTLYQLAVLELKSKYPHVFSRPQVINRKGWVTCAKCAADENYRPHFSRPSIYVRTIPYVLVGSSTCKRCLDHFHKACMNVNQWCELCVDNDLWFQQEIQELEYREAEEIVEEYREAAGRI